MMCFCESGVRPHASYDSAMLHDSEQDPGASSKGDSQPPQRQREKSESETDPDAQRNKMPACILAC